MDIGTTLPPDQRPTRGGPFGHLEWDRREALVAMQVWAMPKDIAKSKIAHQDKYPRRYAVELTLYPKPRVVRFNLIRVRDR